MSCGFPIEPADTGTAAVITTRSTFEIEDPSLGPGRVDFRGPGEGFGHEGTPKPKIQWGPSQKKKPYMWYAAVAHGNTKDCADTDVQTLKRLRTTAPPIKANSPHSTRPTWTQNRKLKYVFLVFSVFGRFSAKVGPRNLPNGPGLKNTT
jgi:hypothetical protein